MKRTIWCFLIVLGIDKHHIVGPSGNHVGIVYFSAYTCLVVWLAFGTPFVHLGADLSYGTTCGTCPLSTCCSY